MKRSLVLLGMLSLCAVWLVGFLPRSSFMESPLAATESNAAANPEIARLWKAFGGDWKTTESMERGEFFPNGGARSGEAHFRLGDGGHVLVEEGGSDGSAGKLDFLIVMWWEGRTHVHRFFTCFNGEEIPC